MKPAFICNAFNLLPVFKLDKSFLQAEQIPYEAPCTLNDTWGYEAFDNNWKSPEEIIRIKKHLNERGINYLLNIGPDYLGRFPVPAIEILRAVGKG